MTFEEKFLSLAVPFFQMVELEGGATDEKVEQYFQVDDKIAPLKSRLTDLAQGDPSALGDMVEFFNDAEVVELLSSENVAAFLKVLALASNITSETWSKEAPEEKPVRIVFLQDGERIEQPHSALGDPLISYFYNSADVTNSVALIDFRSDPTLAKLGSPTNWAPQGEDIIEAWATILLLENIGQVNGCVAVVTSEADNEKAVSYLTYHLVMNGNQLTLPVPLTASRAMQDIQQSLVVTADYSQFVEPFSMLGEVNSCENILDTFLSTYHVLENYMIRSEVSAVLSNSTGRSFQRVRDFKRLGQQTDASEVSHLIRLFNKCWEIQIGGHELRETLIQSFDDVKGDAQWDDDKFDEFLAKLGLLNGSGRQITLGNGFNDEVSLRSNFAKLVYRIRCSIVHNKATEFHLSNEELRRNDIQALIIVKMCLPVMYRIAYGLPSSPAATNPIRYERRELMFY